MANYKSDLRDLLNGKLKRNIVLSLGEMPKNLINLGLPKLELMITQETIHKSMRPKESKRTGHGISRQIIKDLKKLLSDPALVVKEGSKYVVTVNKKDNVGRPIVIAIDGNSDFNKKNINEIRSVYGRNNFENYIKLRKTDNLIIFEDKKRIEKLSHSIHQQYQEASTVNDSMDKIPQQKTDVNSQNKKRIDKLRPSAKPFVTLMATANIDSADKIPQRETDVNSQNLKSTPKPLSKAEWDKLINDTKAERDRSGGRNEKEEIKKLPRSPER